MKHGFTLVELAIVLVIIGLIIGGVLQGQELIRVSQLQQTMKQLDSIKTAANTFKLKYNCLPGDCPGATVYFGYVGSCFMATPSGSTATCNGDGNGQMGYPFSMSGTDRTENYKFFQQLSAAQLIEGEYTGYVTGPSATPLPGADTPIPKRSSVSSQSGQNRIGVGYMESTTGGTSSVPGILWDGPYGNSIFITSSWSFNGLAVEDAYFLDLKFDDGLPASGLISSDRKSRGYTNNCVTTDVATTAIYNIASYAGANLCTLVFRKAF
jgi:prepilin-type N-terminal cleavage/methylation domain-containing protein